MSDKIVQFQKRPDPIEDKGPDPLKVYECSCGNTERFRLYEDGAVQCRDCGHIPTNIRTYDPNQSPQGAA